MLLAHLSPRLPHHRAGFDLVVPLGAGHDFTKKSPRLGSLRNCSKRHNLLTFAGSIYPGTRAKMLALDNPRAGVQIVGKCKFPSDFNGTFCDMVKSRHLAHRPPEEELYNTTFALVPEGWNPSSYRLVEAMSLGCIPVLLGNSYVKPFPSLIPWDSISFEFGPDSLDVILPVLAAARRTPGLVDSMREQVLHYYDEYFSTVEHMWGGVLEVMRSRAQHRGVQP